MWIKTKFDIVKKKQITEKATQWDLIIDEVKVADVWLPNSVCKIENNQIDVPDWLIENNDKLSKVFPDFKPEVIKKENQLDVLKDIRKILKQMSEKCYAMES